MKSNVFFADLKVSSGKTLMDKLVALLDRVNLKEKIREKSGAGDELRHHGHLLGKQALYP